MCKVINIQKIFCVSSTPNPFLNPSTPRLGIVRCCKFSALIIPHILTTFMNSLLYYHDFTDLKVFALYFILFLQSKIYQQDFQDITVGEQYQLVETFTFCWGNYFSIFNAQRRPANGSRWSNSWTKTFVLVWWWFFQRNILAEVKLLSYCIIVILVVSKTIDEKIYIAWIFCALDQIFQIIWEPRIHEFLYQINVRERYTLHHSKCWFIYSLTFLT